jgi:hypothetical protein
MGLEESSAEDEESSADREEVGGAGARLEGGSRAGEDEERIGVGAPPMVFLDKWAGEEEGGIRTPPGPGEEGEGEGEGREMAAVGTKGEPD